MGQPVFRDASPSAGGRAEWRVLRLAVRLHRLPICDMRFLEAMGFLENTASPTVRAIGLEGP